MARGGNRRRKSRKKTLTRRQFLAISLGTFGVGATGWVLWRYQGKVPPQVAETIAKIPHLELPEFPKPTPPPPAPSQPVILPHEEDYAGFLETLNLRYLAPHEIISPHRRERNGIANVLPPRKYWKRLVPTLQIADELRHRLGVKLLYITSAYRSPDYNAQFPGASPRSYHTKNLALDLVYDCPPGMVMDEARKMRAEGLFRGGLGLYKTFIHLDTRGRNANWG
jgi:hypothetical protein